MFNQNASGIGANRSSLRQTRESKYKNKYSFKKSPAYNSVGPLASSFNNNEANSTLKVSQDIINESSQYKAIITNQEFALTQIRNIALNRRNQFDPNSIHTTGNIRELNEIIKIYNLTLININTPPLKYLSEESGRPVLT